jgi:GrpB-like predicted nucleotidyltransferase (UPF0157 family)
METFEQKLQRVLKDRVEIESYDPTWPNRFQAERNHLLSCLPGDLILRIEHYGSTAVPGLASKPIIDMLVEVTDLVQTRERIVPVLEGQGYDYFWRPTSGDDVPPFYAWFIKRNELGQRTHHIHMVEGHFEHWDRLLFRDYLIDNPAVAGEYQDLKYKLIREHPDDRVAYTRAKSRFIDRVTGLARLPDVDG